MSDDNTQDNTTPVEQQVPAESEQTVSSPSSEDTGDNSVKEAENNNTDKIGEVVIKDSAAKSQSNEKDTPESSKKTKPVSKDLEKIIESIEKLSVLELADLVKALEERFGVTAAAPVASISAASATGGAEAPREEQTNFNVILTNGGANKIAVIKAVRELVPTLGLKEAKDLVEGAPKPVLEGVNKETANQAKTKLTAAGGTVELQ